MLHVSTQSNLSSDTLRVFLPRHLRKLICATTPSISALSPPYPCLKGRKIWGAHFFALGSIGALSPSQERPHNNPLRHVQLVHCQSLALTGKGWHPTLGSGFGVGEKLRHSWEDSSLLLCLLASQLTCFLPSLLICFFLLLLLSPLDVQLPDSNSSSLACSQYLCGFPSIKLKTTFCLMFSVGSVRGQFKCHKVRFNDFLGH